MQTEGDGNCLLRAVLGCCEFEDLQEGLRYGYHQLRLQFVYHLVTHREELFDVIADDIKMSYGDMKMRRDIHTSHTCWRW